jgi:hypothetical protein
METISMAQTFITTIIKADDSNATGISVPPAVVAALGTRKKPPVKVTLNGYTYRSTIAAYQDTFMLPLAREHRDAAGVKAGDKVEITLELDLEAREVHIPDDLALALSHKPGARDAFDALSYTNRKEYARLVESAKAQETRERRIAAIVAKLSGG